jgi:uncharacterized MAPEG superfamily protein
MNAISALLVFAALPLVLMALYISHRVTNILFARAPADSWTRGVEKPVPAFFLRAQHAQLNVLENLPIFAAIVIAAQALGRTGAIDPLAPYLLVARLAQTATHLIGVNHALVLVRAGFFTIQVVLFVMMFARLLS